MRALLSVNVAGTSDNDVFEIAKNSSGMDVFLNGTLYDTATAGESIQITGGGGQDRVICNLTGISATNMPSLSIIADGGTVTLLTKNGTLPTPTATSGIDLSVTSGSILVPQSLALREVTLGGSGTFVTSGESSVSVKTLNLAGDANVLDVGGALLTLNNTVATSFGGSAVLPSIVWSGNAQLAKIGAGTLSIDGSETIDANAQPSLAALEGTTNFNIGLNSRSLELAASAQVNFRAPVQLHSLDVLEGGNVRVVAGPNFLITDTLSVDASAALDVNEGVLVVNSTTLSSLSGLLHNGQVFSSAVVLDNTVGTGVLGLGHIDNFDISYSGIGPNNTLTSGGLIPGAEDFDTQFVIRYTYIGDVNLDGKVTTWDYDFAFGNLGTTTNDVTGSPVIWGDGDFNGNGVVDTTDVDTLFANLGLGQPGNSNIDSNFAPSLFSIPNQAVHVGGTLAASLFATDDIVTLIPAPLNYSLTLPASLPVVSGSMPTLSANGDLVWTPAASQAGTWTLTARATDIDVDPMYDEKTFQVTVKVNQAPVFAPLPSFGNVTIPAIDPTTGEASTLPPGNANIPATDLATGLPAGIADPPSLPGGLPGPPDISSLLQYVEVGVPIEFPLTATHAEGDTVHYFLGEGSPAGAYIDDDNVFHWTPDDSDVGEQTIWIYATDGSDATLDFLSNGDALQYYGFGDTRATLSAIGDGGITGMGVPVLVIARPQIGEAANEGLISIDYIGPLGDGTGLPLGLGLAGGNEQLIAADHNVNPAFVFTLTSQPDHVDVGLTSSGYLSTNVFYDGTPPPTGSFNIDYKVTNSYGLSRVGRAYLSIGPTGSLYYVHDPAARNYELFGGMGIDHTVPLISAMQFSRDVNSLSRFVIDTPPSEGQVVLGLNGESMNWIAPYDKFEGTDWFTYHIQNYAMVDGRLLEAGTSNHALVTITDKAYLVSVPLVAKRNFPDYDKGIQQPWQLFATGIHRNHGRGDQSYFVIEKVIYNVTTESLRGEIKQYSCTFYRALPGSVALGVDARLYDDAASLGFTPTKDARGNPLVKRVTVKVKVSAVAFARSQELEDEITNPEFWKEAAQWPLTRGINDQFDGYSIYGGERSAQAFDGSKYDALKKEERTRRIDETFYFFK